MRRHALAFWGLWLTVRGHAIAAERPLVFKHVNVIPMTGEELVADQTIVIRGDEIVAIGSSASVEIPRGATVVEAPDRYVIPGLCDLHVHLRGGPRDNPNS